MIVDENAISELIGLGKTKNAIDLCIKTSARLNYIAASLMPPEEAIPFLKQQYKDAALYSLLTTFYLSQGQEEDALTASLNGLECPEPSFENYYNHGLVLSRLKWFKQAEEAFRKAINLNYDFAPAHLNLGKILLAKGALKEGAAEYEWRYKAISHCIRRKQRYKPFLTPDIDIKGKRIVLFNDQGLGDAIQFIRYASRLKDAYLILEVQHELVDLFKGLNIFDEIYGSGVNDYPDLPDHDYSLSIFSLFNYCGAEIIPSVKFLEERPIIKDAVGLVWAGSKFHNDDCNRSCPLRFFNNFGSKLFSFQHGDMVRSWRQSKTSMDCQVVDLMAGSTVVFQQEVSGTLKEVAEVLLLMDWVVSVDTAIAHLAASLGKRVILLLPHDYDWRWNHTWYENVTILRQPTPGNWSAIIQKAKAIIAAQ